MTRITVFILALFLASCATQGTFNPEPAASVAVTLAVSEDVTKNPSHVAAFRSAAEALDIAATGHVDVIALRGVLAEHLSGRALVVANALLAAYFPPDASVDVPTNETVARVAKMLASAIRAALPVR